MCINGSQPRKKRERKYNNNKKQQSYKKKITVYAHHFQKDYNYSMPMIKAFLPAGILTNQQE